MSDFLPSEELVRNMYANGRVDEEDREGNGDEFDIFHALEEFDRWLEARDAEVRRQAAEGALLTAADEIFVPHNENRDMSDAFHRGADAVYDALRARAAEYKKAEG